MQQSGVQTDSVEGFLNSTCDSCRKIPIESIELPKQSFPGGGNFRFLTATSRRILKSDLETLENDFSTVFSSSRSRVFFFSPPPDKYKVHFANSNERRGRLKIVSRCFAVFRWRCGRKGRWRTGYPTIRERSIDDRRIETKVRGGEAISRLIRNSVRLNCDEITRGWGRSFRVVFYPPAARISVA